jgi:putative membrane protein
MSDARIDPDSALDRDALARLDAAVAEAERRTAAEIVVGVTAKSGRYLHVVYEAGLVGACVALGVYAVAAWFVTRLWPVAPVDVFAAVAAAGFVCGAIGARHERIARFFAGEEAMLDACERRARETFALHDVRRTRERNGVLLFFSLFERIVLVRGDDAVAAALPPETWRETVEAAIAELRAGRTEAGVAVAIEKLGARLAVAFPRDAADVNELPDRVYVL